MSQDLRLKLSRNYQKKLQGEGVEIIKGQKMANSVTYRVYLQDHTLGDLLRIYLLKDRQVKYAGYKVPHPLEDFVEIKVQTKSQDPNKVVKDTLKSVQKEIFEIQSEFASKVAAKIRQNH